MTLNIKDLFHFIVVVLSGGSRARLVRHDVRVMGFVRVSTSRRASELTKYKQNDVHFSRSENVLTKWPN